MLPTFQVQAKNLSPDKQMALMRQYLNQLKDDTETELYDIKWDNLSKPLRDKLNSLESYSETSQQQIDQINATVVKADSIETLVLQAGFIKAETVAANYVATTFLEAHYITADQIAANYVATNYLTANYITANTIASTYLKTNDLTADLIVGKFVDGNQARFSNLNIDMKSNLRTGLRLYEEGTFFNVMLEPYGPAGHYIFSVDLPPH